MFYEDIVAFLLQKKTNLRENLEREYAEREAYIDRLLSEAGYVPPVVEEAAEQTEAVDAAESMDPCGQGY